MNLPCRHPRRYPHRLLDLLELDLMDGDFVSDGDGANGVPAGCSAVGGGAGLAVAVGGNGDGFGTGACVVGACVGAGGRVAGACVSAHRIRWKTWLILDM